MQENARCIHPRPWIPSSRSQQTFPPIHILPTSWSLRKCEAETPGARAGRHFEAADPVWWMVKEGAWVLGPDAQTCDADSSDLMEDSALPVVPAHAATSRTRLLLC